MKKILSLISFIFLSSIIYGQIEFSDPFIIANDFDPRANKSISIGDLDNDDDSDIVATDYSSSDENPLLAWYRNDGSGNFTRNIINTENLSSEELVSGTCVCIADIDNDNDPDIILGSFTGENSISWFENLDGKGNFSSFKTIKATEGHHLWPHAADFDNDSDMDVIDADWDGLELYRNTDGNGTFEKEVVNSDSPISLLSLDIGNDGDEDIIAGFIDKIVWYENLDGSASFSSEKLITRSGYGFLYLADIDNDGDLDLLSAGNNKVAWHENTNGQGLFSSPHNISSSVNNAYAVCSADHDEDGDQDVLSGSHFDSKLAWYENIDGLGTFGVQNLIEHNFFGVASVHTANIDNDGRPDIIAATSPDFTDNQFIPGKIFWLKNNTNTTSVKKIQDKIVGYFQLYHNYPNPFNSTTTIRYSLPQAGRVSLEIYNLLGQKLETLVKGFQQTGEHWTTWHADELSSGIYLYRLQAGEFSETKKLILQK